MNNRFNELILLAADKKKKGGSLGSVFKLIQDLTEFEEKIQEAINAQEMAENRQIIEGFLGSIDQMYEALLSIAKGGIHSLRSERARMGEMGEMDEEAEGGEDTVEKETPEGPVSGARMITEKELSDIGRLTAPKAPRI